MYVLYTLWSLSVALFCVWFVGYPIYKHVTREGVFNESHEYALGLLWLALANNILTLAIKLFT